MKRKPEVVRDYRALHGDLDPGLLLSPHNEVHQSAGGETLLKAWYVASSGAKTEGVFRVRVDRAPLAAPRTWTSASEKPAEKVKLGATRPSSRSSCTRTFLLSIHRCREISWSANPMF